MREILKIALNLFVISVCSATLLGFIFMGTEAAKSRNERQRLENSMVRYLPEAGQGAKDVEFHRIYRYFIQEGDKALIGYVVPSQTGHILLVVTPEGTLTSQTPLADTVDLENENARDDAVKATLPKGVQCVFTDMYISAVRDGVKLASFIKGKTVGFKTWVNMLIALDESDNIKGLEILEHEEDPGLGAEIEQEYFRNQFVGKSLEQLNGLSVQKRPLPSDYRNALERSKWGKMGLTQEEAERIRQQYKDQDIYAITGATISSRRVTDGVKKLVAAYVQRMRMIHNVVAEQRLSVAF